MNYRDSNKVRLLKTLRWEETDRIPNLETLFESNHVDAILGKQSGKSSWELAPSDQIELALRTGIDMLFVGGYGKFGQQYKVMDDGSSQYTDGSIKNRQIYNSWDFIGDFQKKLDLISYNVKRLTDETKKTSVGAAVALRSVFADTSLSMGLTDFMMNLYDDPKLIGMMMDLYLEFALKVIDIISKYSVDMVLIDDDLSDSRGLMIGKTRTRELWFSRTKMITDKLNSLGIPYIGHCCGNLDEVIPMFVELGYLAVHPIQPSCNDIYSLRDTYNKKIAFIGNIDILETLARGTEEKVREEVTEHIMKLGKEGGYVLTSSHTMVNSIPFSNYKTMLKTLHKLCNGPTFFRRG
jgi:uroporphyrinogen-III decarboxylase